MLDVHQTLAPHNRNGWMSTHGGTPKKSSIHFDESLLFSVSMWSVYAPPIHTTTIYTEPQSHSGVMGAAP